jgi:hypothetical protein
MKLKPIQLTDPRAIDAAKDFAQTRKQLQKDYALLQMKHSREINDLMASYKKQFRDQFRIAAGSVMDDPDEAFSASTHALDISYIDFDIVFLVPKAPENPTEDSDDETSGDSVPDRVIIN